MLMLTVEVWCVPYATHVSFIHHGIIVYQYSNFLNFFVIQFSKELAKKTGNREIRWLPPQNLPSFITWIVCYICLNYSMTRLRAGRRRNCVSITGSQQMFPRQSVQNWLYPPSPAASYGGAPSSRIKLLTYHILRRGCECVELFIYSHMTAGYA
jgi:hypothetical protein